ncbi:MAG: hypothetical protein AAF772_15695, partial [Acidobacteriota bacterium]
MLQGFRALCAQFGLFVFFAWVGAAVALARCATAQDAVVQGDAIFADGFESATSMAWRETVPAVELRVIAPLPGARVNDARAPLVLDATTITGVAVDVASIAIAYDDGEPLAAACVVEADGRTFTCAPDADYAEGPVALSARAFDLLGRPSRDVAATFTVDVTPPEIAVTSPIDGLRTRDDAVVV